MTGINFNNPNSYKNCQKKLYEVYVCIPSRGTIIINELEQADVVEQLGGKTYFTVDDIAELQQSDSQLVSKLQQLVEQAKAYAVTDTFPFVLCGAGSKMRTIRPEKLMHTYTFVQDGKPLQINNQMLADRMKNGLLDWTVVGVSEQAIHDQNMACFVPSSQKGQILTSRGIILNLNGDGVSHGKGDFEICTKLPNGQPNLADMWVVNGETFAATYNNGDCLDLGEMNQESQVGLSMPNHMSISVGM